MSSHLRRIFVPSRVACACFSACTCLAVGSSGDTGRCVQGGADVSRWEQDLTRAYHNYASSLTFISLATPFDCLATSCVFWRPANGMGWCLTATANIANSQLFIAEGLFFQGARRLYVCLTGAHLCILNLQLVFPTLMTITCFFQCAIFHPFYQNACHSTRRDDGGAGSVGCAMTFRTSCLDFFFLLFAPTVQLHTDKLTASE